MNAVSSAYNTKATIQPTPASSKMPLEPRIDTMPIPPYYEPFLRPPPRSPDKTATKDNRKDL